VSVLAVAHRAGNDLAALRRALDLGVPVVEADVHASRGRLELRHEKVLGPLPVLWDRGPWTLVRRRPVLELDALVAALDSPAALLLDLKGVGSVGRRTLAALHAARPAEPVLVCGRWWPAVDAVAADWARPVLSARSRADLARLRARVRRRPPWGVSLHGSLLTEPVVAELRGRVERVLTWGVEDLPALERVTALGVNGVISTSPAVLRAAVAA
jgi:glycerophosphoryl diester phosphodiesterase